MSGSSGKRWEYKCPPYSPSSKAKSVHILEKFKEASSNSNSNSHPKQIPARAIDKDALSQFKLNNKINGYFTLTKELKVKSLVIPAGTAGRVVHSKRQKHAIVATFATPYDNIETVVDPDEYFSFGMYVHSQLCK